MESNFNGDLAVPREVERDEELFAQAFVHSRVMLPITMKAAADLGLFEILAQGCHSIGGGDAKSLMTAHELAALIPTKNPKAADMIDRLLQLLASFEVVMCEMELDATDKVVRKYGPGPICKWLTKNKNGDSMADFFLFSNHPSYMKGLFYIKDAILEGGTGFEKAHGMSVFEFQGTDPKLNVKFNEAMKVQSTLTTEKMLEVYNGFRSVRVLVDVGGGVGETISSIISKYGHIKGINFDLPHVISQAPSFPGVEHIGGDMFATVPSGDAVFMKMILHNWSDEHCQKVLKNCYKALPDNGKVIIMDLIRPEKPESNIMTQFVLFLDVNMMASFGGKERTKKEIEAIGKEAGFSKFKSTYVFAQMWAVEMIKEN